MKDGRQLLRLSLPVGKDMLMGSKARESISFKAQEALELIRLRLEETGYTNPSAWPPAKQDLEYVQTLLKGKSADTFVSTARSPAEAQELIDKVIKPKIEALDKALQSRDIPKTVVLQEEVADAFGKLRSLELPMKTLPYKIPEEYSALPRLLGRAKIEMKIESQNGFRDEQGKKLPSAVLVLEVDGYHAPLTAGNFVDLGV